MVTEKEKELIEVVKDFDNDKNFITCVCLLARESGKVNEVIDFIKNNKDEIDNDDIINFLLDDEDFENNNE